MRMSDFVPTADDRFTFGLWTVGNPGRDPFGEPTRPVQRPTHLVERLAACGAWGVNLHDNDLVPFGASAAERDRIVSEYRDLLASEARHHQIYVDLAGELAPAADVRERLRELAIAEAAILESPSQRVRLHSGVGAFAAANA